MSEKALDKHGRWRSVSQNFRSSPEENEIIRFNVRISGLTKQEYLVSSALEKEININPGPRLHKVLKDELSLISIELRDARENGGYITPETFEKIDTLLTIIEKLKEN